MNEDKQESIPVFINLNQIGHCVLQYATKPQLFNTVEIKTDLDTAVQVTNLNTEGWNYKNQSATLVIS